MELFSELIKNISVIELIMFIGGIAFFASKLKENSEANKELLSNELKHVIHIMEINHKNLSEERLAMQEVLTADIQAMLKAHIADEHNHNN